MKNIRPSILKKFAPLILGVVITAGFAACGQQSNSGVSIDTLMAQSRAGSLQAQNFRFALQSGYPRMLWEVPATLDAVYSISAVDAQNRIVPYINVNCSGGACSVQDFNGNTLTQGAGGYSLSINVLNNNSVRQHDLTVFAPIFIPITPHHMQIRINNGLPVDSVSF